MKNSDTTLNAIRNENVNTKKCRNESNTLWHPVVLANIRSLHWKWFLQTHCLPWVTRVYKNMDLFIEFARLALNCLRTIFSFKPRCYTLHFANWDPSNTITTLHVTITFILLSYFVMKDFMTRPYYGTSIIDFLSLALQYSLCTSFLT